MQYGEPFLFFGSVCLSPILSRPFSTKSQIRLREAPLIPLLLSLSPFVFTSWDPPGLFLPFRFPSYNREFCPFLSFFSHCSFFIRGKNMAPHSSLWLSYPFSPDVPAHCLPRDLVEVAPASPVRSLCFCFTLFRSIFLLGFLPLLLVFEVWDDRSSRSTHFPLP